MTIICAMHKQGIGTWIGSDSRATVGAVVAPVSIAKWAFVGLWAIGHTGEPRSLSLVVKHAERLGDIHDPFDLATALRDLLRDDGYRSEDRHGEPSDYGQRWLIASAIGLWDSDGAGSLTRIQDECLWARGSGRDFALGAGFAAPDTMPAKDVVLGAIRAACHYDTGCGGEPFVHLLPAG